MTGEGLGGPRRLFAAVGVAGCLTALVGVAVPGHAHAAPAGAGCARASGAYRGATPWPQQLLDLDRVRPLTTGTGVTVAVLATGVDARHPQLGRERVEAGADVRAGARGPADTDCDGRGTFAAGVVAAAPVGGTSFAGVAPGARIVPVRWTGTTTRSAPTGDADALARGIDYAVRAGAGVIVVPTAGPQQSATLRRAVDAALRRDVVLVAAGAHVDRGPTYPTAYPGVLAVTGVGPDGTELDGADRGRHIVVSAPGTGLVGTAPGGGHRWGVTSPGTAAAYVAGVAALVRAYRPELSARQVVRRIQLTATPPSSGLRPDPVLGWGTVNAYAAVAGEQPDAGSPRPVTETVVRLAGPRHRTAGPRVVRAALLAAGVAAVGVPLLCVPVLRRRAGRATR